MNYSRKIKNRWGPMKGSLTCLLGEKCWQSSRVIELQRQQQKGRRNLQNNIQGHCLGGLVGFRHMNSPHSNSLQIRITYSVFSGKDVWGSMWAQEARHISRWLATLRKNEEKTGSEIQILNSRIIHPVPFSGALEVAMANVYGIHNKA